MSQAAKAQEPSMEEILASIRRIIADDEGVKPPQKPPAPLAAPPASAAVAAPPPPQARAPLQAVPPPEPGAMSQADIDSMLADFDRPEEPEPVEAPPAAPPDDDIDVLELTEAMEARPAGLDSFRTIDAKPDVMFNEMEPPPPRAEPRARDLPERMLLSDHATASVASAFGSLAHTVLAQNARTLDDLVKDMLRPMLKAWLDDNLPTIVERLVRAEIERVSRGR
jgi:cell pole-organizing protein PopZ